MHRLLEALSPVQRSASWVRQCSPEPPRGREGTSLGAARYPVMMGAGGHNYPTLNTYTLSPPGQ